MGASDASVVCSAAPAESTAFVSSAVESDTAAAISTFAVVTSASSPLALASPFATSLLLRWTSATWRLA